MSSSPTRSTGTDRANRLELYFEGGAAIRRRPFDFSLDGVRRHATRASTHEVVCEYIVCQNHGRIARATDQRAAARSRPTRTAESGIPFAKRCAARIATTPKGTSSRAILILAIPMVLEMIMESVFAVCDVFFVSKLGATAVAAVGLTESWLTLIYAIAMGLAISASAMVARRTGERDREGAAQAAGQGILLGLAGRGRARRRRRSARAATARRDGRVAGRDRAGRRTRASCSAETS